MLKFEYSLEEASFRSVQTNQHLMVGGVGFILVSTGRVHVLQEYRPRKKPSGRYFRDTIKITPDAILVMTDFSHDGIEYRPYTNPYAYVFEDPAGMYMVDNKKSQYEIGVVGDRVCIGGKDKPEIIVYDKNTGLLQTAHMLDQRAKYTKVDIDDHVGYVNCSGINVYGLVRAVGFDSNKRDSVLVKPYINIMVKFTSTPAKDVIKDSPKGAKLVVSAENEDLIVGYHTLFAEASID